MWLFVMFDLPTATKKERKAYADFRNNIEKDGFRMMQYSVYVRFCASLETAKVHVNRIRKIVPEEGRVSILMVTDKQYSDIINIYGMVEKKNKKMPKQIELF